MANLHKKNMATKIDGENLNDKLQMRFEVIGRKRQNEMKANASTVQEPCVSAVSQKKQKSVVSKTKCKADTVICDTAIERAKQKLLEISNADPESAPFRDRDGDASWGPVVVSEKILKKDFLYWLELHEGKIRRWIYEPLSETSDAGKVFIYSIPLDAHENASDYILGTIIKQIQQAGNNIDLADTLRRPASPRCEIGNRTKEPDGTVSPINLAIGGNILNNGHGKPFPNLVVEISYQNESLPLLREYMNLWMSPLTSVQVAIGIKIFDLTRQGTRRMVAIFCQRNQRNQEVEFGTDVGPGPFNINIPIASIYFGVPLPQELANLNNPHVSIDLVALRNVILNSI